MQDQLKLLSRYEVASEIGVSVGLVDRAIRRGELTAVRLGGRVLVRREAVELWLKACESKREGQLPATTAD